jgi:hypothetical protein
VNIPVSITLENREQRRLSVRVPRGYVFEQATRAGRVQNVAIVDDHVFDLAPGERRVVTMIGRCLNPRRSIPTGQAGRPTMFRYSGRSMDQQAVWDRVRRPLP